VKEGDTVLDPFCGTGSVLIEAGLMGMKVIGSDIDAGMVHACKRNLELSGLDGEVFQKGISEFSIPNKADAIVTDLPYGKSASLHGAEKGKLYGIALDRFAELVKPGGFSVVVADRALETDEMKLAESYKIRVHGSLTRHVHVFRN
jgi:tRNA (guanine10-N2)-dimethyltransferase